MTPEELANPEPVTYADNVAADITPEGTLKYTFPDPRPISEISLQTAKPEKPVEVVFELDDGTNTSPVPLDTSSDEPTRNDIPDQPNVVKVVIKNVDNSPLTPDDIIFAEVIACKEGKKHSQTIIDLN